MPEYLGPSERSGQYRSRACIFSIPFLQVINVLVSSVGSKNTLLLLLDHSYTEDPRYNDSVFYQRFCSKIEFAVIEKLDRTHL